MHFKILFWNAFQIRFFKCISNNFQNCFSNAFQKNILKCITEMNFKPISEMFFEMNSCHINKLNCKKWNAFFLMNFLKAFLEMRLIWKCVFLKSVWSLFEIHWNSYQFFNFFLKYIYFILNYFKVNLNEKTTVFVFFHRQHYKIKFFIYKLRIFFKLLLRWWRKHLVLFKVNF